MKRISVIALSLMCCSFALSAEENSSAITVWENGTQPSVKGSADYFTGSVRIDAPFKGTGAARVSGASVTFEPAARTAWHTHPQGQTLIVTAGVGRVQEWGKPVREIRPGDTVWIPRA